jgi:hypothetical protein
MDFKSIFCLSERTKSSNDNQDVFFFVVVDVS